MLSEADTRRSLEDIVLAACTFAREAITAFWENTDEPGRGKGR
jgi:hypothetical protein